MVLLLVNCKCLCVSVRGSWVHLRCSAGSEGQMDVWTGAGLEGNERQTLFHSESKVFTFFKTSTFPSCRGLRFSLSSGGSVRVCVKHWWWWWVYSSSLCQLDCLVCLMVLCLVSRVSDVWMIDLQFSSAFPLRSFISNRSGVQVHHKSS